MSRISKPSNRRPKAHRYALESRQMYDGAALVEAAQHHHATIADHSRDVRPVEDVGAAAVAPRVSEARQAEARQAAAMPGLRPSGQEVQVYAIDQSVAGWRSLVAQLPKGSQVIVLDGKSSGLGQLAAALQGEHDIAALHIISHGASDSISLGTDTVTASNAVAYARQLDAIGASLGERGDILLYGCEVAAQDGGLITQLASLTRADVAASTDLTGAARLGGDWELEAAIGTVEVRALQLDYAGLLEAPTVKTSSPGLTVAEPSTLNSAGADRATLSGWQIDDDGLDASGNPDATVTVDATVADTSVGTLSNAGGATAIAGGFRFTGTAADAAIWLNQLQFTAADAELGTSAAKTTIDVTVTDAQSLQSSHSLDVTVTPANDPVVVPDAVISVDEVDVGGNPTTTVITAGMLAAQDAEVDQAHTQQPVQIVYTLGSLPQYGYVALDGERLGVGSVFTQQDVIGGKLTYVHTTVSGASQDATDGFDLSVNDGATPLSQSATPHVTIQIDPVNQAPTVDGSGAVFEGQPYNAQGTGNVGQYIVTGTGGDPGDSVTIYVTSLPTHGKLYYGGVELTAGMVAGGYAIADRNLLTYENDGADGVGSDAFGVRVTDTGGSGGGGTSTDSTIQLTVRPVDDDPAWDGSSTLEATVTAAGEGGSPYVVTLTSAMLHVQDVDSADNVLSFITHWSEEAHKGFLVLDGQILADGASFTMADVQAGRVQYVQTDGAIAGDIDQFTFQVVDNTSALRWKGDGSTFVRMGGVYTGTEESAALQDFTFTIHLAPTASGNGDTWIDPPQIGVVDHDSSYAGTDPGGGAGASRGSLEEGGTIVLSGTGADFASQPGLSYVVHDAVTGDDIDPSQVVYTFLGFDDADGGGNGSAGTLQKLVGVDWVDIGQYGTFTQADLNAGHIRFQHDGDSENFHVSAGFSVSAGVLVDDGSGQLVQDVWTPTFGFYVTPANDAPVATGSSDTVIAEGGTAHITTDKLHFSDADDATSEAFLEGSTSILDADGNPVDNYAYDNDASGSGALKFVVDSLPAGGTLEYFDGSNWVAVTAGQALDASLLTASDGTTGLRFVGDSSETRSTSFTVHAQDRWGATSAPATVDISITNVNDAPQIAHDPTQTDPVGSDANNIGGAAANEPLTVIQEGGYTQITSDMLQAYDPDSTAEQVQYRITGAPTRGNVAYSVDGVSFSIIGVGSSFSQQDVADGHIYYINDGDEPSGNTYAGTPDDKFVFTVSDGNKEQTGNEFWIYVQPTNDAPTVTAPSGPVRIDGDASHASGNLVAGFSVSDVDLTDHSGSALTDYVQVVVRLLDKDGNPLPSAQYGEVTIGHATADAGVVDADKDGQHDYLVLRGTRGQVNATLAGLTVSFDSDQDKVYQVQVIADDRLRDPGTHALSSGANGGTQDQAKTPPGAPVDVPTTEYDWYADAVPTSGDITGNVSAKAVTVWASDTNDPPTVSVPGAQAPYEDTAFMFSQANGNGITIADAESSAFGLDVQVTLSVGQGTLDAGSHAGVTIGGGGTGTLVLTGAVDDIQALLDSGFTYTGKSQYNGTDTLTVTLDEHDAAVGGDTGGGSVKNPDAVQTVALDLIAVNDAPTVSMPAGPVAVGTNTTVAVGGISIGDAADFSDGVDTGETDFVQVTVRLLDAAGNPVTDYSGINLATGTSGATVDATWGGNGEPLVLRGSRADVNAALVQLTVSMSGDRNATYQLQVLVDDRSRDASGALTGGADGGAVNQQGGLPAVPTGDAFAADPVNTATSVAAGLYDVAASTVVLHVSSVNEAPVNDMPTALSLPEDSVGAAVKDAGGNYIQIGDADDFGAPLTVTLTATGGTLSIGDYAGVSGDGVSGQGSITLTGSKTDLNAALQGLKFNATANLHGATGIANIHVKTIDTALPGSGPNQTAESDLAIELTPVNDRPVIGKNVTLPAVSEDDGAPLGASFDSLDFGYSDATDDQTAAGGGDTSTGLSYIAIVGSTDYVAGQGTWQVSVDGGTSWIDIPASGLDAGNALVFAASSQIRFVPAANFHGTPGTLTVRAADGSAAITASTSATDFKSLDSDGGTDTTGAWSNESKTIGTTVTNVNDRPTAGNASMPATDEDVTNSTGATVGSLGTAFGYSDATDDQSAITGGGNASTGFGGIAIVGNAEDGSHGTWQYSTNGGASWVDIGSASDGSAVVLDTAARIRFVPGANYNGVPGTLDVRVSDTGVTSATGVDLTGATGQTGHWSDPHDLAITVNPRNDAPTLAATASNPSKFENATTDSGLSVDPVKLYGGATLADIDLSTTGGLDGATFGAGTVIVTISDHQAGDELFVDAVLPSGVSQSYDAGTGMLTISLDQDTTLAEVKALVEAVSYQNTSDNPTLDQTHATRSYSLVVRDGNNAQTGGDAGGPAALSTAPITGTLTITPVNDAPEADLNGGGSGTGNSVTWTEGANLPHVPVAIAPGAVLADFDNDNLKQMVLTVGGVLNGNSEVLNIGGHDFALGTDASNVDVGGYRVGYDAGTGAFTIVPDGSSASAVTGFQSLLRSVTYVNLADDASDGDRTVSVKVTDAGYHDTGVASDGELDSNVPVATINVDPVNDQPRIGGLTDVTYNENDLNGAAALLDGSVTLTDMDSADFDGGTLTVSGLVAGQDIVSFATSAPASPAAGEVWRDGTDVKYYDGSAWVSVGTCSGGAGTDFVVTFNASATRDVVQSVIEHLTFANSSDNPTASRTLTLAVSDGDAGGSVLGATVGVTIRYDNDAPVLGADSLGGSFTEGGTPLQFIQGNITVGDPDGTGDADFDFYDNASGGAGTLTAALDQYVPGDVLTVVAGNSITVSGSAISFGGQAFASFSGGDAGALLITFTSDSATPQAVKALLGQLRYGNSSNDPTANATDTSRNFTVTLNDADNVDDATGLDVGALAATLAGTITVVPAADAPAIGGLAGTVAFTEDGGPVTVDGDLTVSDADDTQIAGGTVTISGGYLPSDVLAITGAYGIGTSYAGGVLTLTGTATLAQYQEVLRTLTFDNTSDDPTNNAAHTTRTLTYSLTDANSDALTTATTGTATKTVDVTPLTDKPAVAVDGEGAYTENAAPAVIDDSVTVTDADDAQLVSATVRISGGLSTGDLLAVSGTAMGDFVAGTTITVAGYDAATGVLTLTGTDTVAHYNQVLRSVTFANTSDNPTGYGAVPTRTVTWQAVDANSDLAGTGQSVEVTSTIDITAANDAPLASPDTGAVNEGETLTATAANGVIQSGTVPPGRDTDVDNVTLDLTVIGVRVGTAADVSGVGTQHVGAGLVGTYGTLTLNADGSYSYVADQTAADALAAGGTADDVFSYAISDGAGGTAFTTLTITVTGKNDAPVGVDDTGAASEAGGTANGTAGSNAAGAVLANDTDVDSGDSKAVSAVAFGGTSGTVGSGMAGAYGTLTLNDDGTYTYVVDDTNATVQALQAGDTLTETFTYTVKDAAGLTDTATLTITINGANDAPVGVDDTGTATEAGGTANGTAGSNAAGAVLANDTDVDAGDSRTVSAVAFGGTSGTVGSGLTGAYGTLTLNDDGTYTYVVDDTNAAVQALQAGDTLTETFTYTVKDAAGLTDTATLTITINGANDAPAGVDDTGTATEAGGTANGTAGSNAAGAVLANDTDVDAGDSKAVSAVAFGGTSGTVGSGLAGAYGTLTLAADGAYTYVVDDTNATVQALQAGDTLTETFTYTVKDAAGLTDTATLTITINGANDAPVGVDDTGTATEAGGTANGTAGSNAAGAVLASDTDVDAGDSRTVSAVAFGGTSGTVGTGLAGAYGTLTLNDDGTYTYVADDTNAAVQALQAGDTLTETFTYTVKDAHGLTDTATLTITVNGANDNPVAKSDLGEVTEDGATLAVGAADGVIRSGSAPAGTDTDVDDATADLTVAGVATGTVADAAGVGTGHVGTGLDGAYGTLTLNADGSYGYAVNNDNAAVNALKDGDTLTDVFTYAVADGSGGTAVATLTVTIHGHTDGTPSVTPVDGNGGEAGHATVHESGLVDGDGSQSVTGAIDVALPDGLGSIAIAGSAPVPVGALEHLDTSPVTITLADGTLTLTGFTATATVGGVPTAGKLEYTYTLTRPDLQPGAAQSTRTLALEVTGAGGDTANGSLVIDVVDDVPTAHHDAGDVTEDGAPATGRVVANDRVGGDATGTPVTAVSFGATAGTLGSGLSGAYGTLTLNADGSYSYAVDGNSAAVNALKDGDTLTETFGYTITDADGDSSAATLTITIHGRTGGAPSIVPVDANGAADGQATVHESGLADADGTQATTGSVTVGAPEGLAGVTVGGTTLSVSQLAALDADHPVTIDTPGGTLVLTGFTPTATVGGVPTTGTLSYSYTLDGRQAQPGAEHGTESVALSVSDAGGGKSTGTLVVTIVDDVPAARDDANGVTEDRSTPATGSVVANDRVGADTTPTPVTAVSFGGTAGTVGSGLSGAYGRLTLDADGSYSYAVDDDNAAVNALRDGDTLTETFAYAITDADGDSSTATLTITIHGHTDGDPEAVPVDGNGDGGGHATVRESGLVHADGSQATTGSIDVSAPDGLSGISVGGHDITLAQLAALSDKTPLVIETAAGRLTLTGFSPGGQTGGVPTSGALSYSYELTTRQDQPGEIRTTDTIAITVIDAGGTRSEGSLAITIVDDLPSAHDDQATVEQKAHEDRTSGNVFEDAAAPAGTDRIGADGAGATGPVTGVSSVNLERAGQVGAPTQGAYGALTLNADGSYTYVIDTRNPAVAALDIGQTLTETFVYTITDADGDTSQATLTVTIGGQPSQVPLRQGDQIFPVAYDHDQRTIDQGYAPGLFIVPVVNDVRHDAQMFFGARVEGREFADGDLLHSSLLQIPQDPANAQHVLRDGVGFSRRMLAEIHGTARVPLSDLGLGSRALWDDFSPFAPNRVVQRAEAEAARSHAQAPEHGRDHPAPAPEATHHADTQASAAMPAERHGAPARVLPTIVVPAAAAPPAGAQSLSARVAQMAQAGVTPLPRVIPVAPTQPPAGARP